MFNIFIVLNLFVEFILIIFFAKNQQDKCIGLISHHKFFEINLIPIAINDKK